MAKNLFDLSVSRNVVSEKVVLDKLNKAKEIVLPTKERTKGTNMLTLIQNVSRNVETYLGDKKDRYMLLTEENDIIHYFDKMIENGIFSIDTETTGLDPLEDYVVGFSVYTPGEKAVYVPLEHISYITKVKLENQPSKEFIRQQFQRLIDAKTKAIYFNAKFDYRMIRHSIGIDLPPYFDCFVAARLLNENEPSNGLKQLHKKYILRNREDAFTFGELFEGIRFDQIPPNLGYLYAARDAEITYELYEFQVKYFTPGTDEYFRHEMQQLSDVFWKIEMPAVPVLADLEDTGVLIDQDRANELHELYVPAIQKAEANFHAKVKEFGIEQHFDITSSRQLAILIYDVLKLESPDPQKPRGTGKEILNQLQHPIIDALKDFRALSTLVNTFVIKLPKVVNKKTGRIHCHYNQLGTDTGRLSCNDPNMQNIPSHAGDIRTMFCATPGYVMIGSDFSQQEPKMAAYLSRDENLLKAASTGRDIYSSIAAIAFNTTYENCCEFNPDHTKNDEGKARRTQAKTIVLGILYGRGVPALAEQLHCSVEEAQKIQDSVLATFTGLKAFKQSNELKAKTKGYVETAWGRRRRLPDMALPNFSFMPSKSRQATGNLLTDDEVNHYQQALGRARSKASKAQIILEAKAAGIIIFENNAKIARATRQCVNASVQGCLNFDTMLFVQDEGFKKIGELANQTVTLWSGKEWTRGDIVYSGKKQLCKVKFSDGSELLCSPNHKFAISIDDDKFIPCEDIEVGTAVESTTSNLDGAITKVYVESKVITNDFVDMYDVCNTDKGYYLANNVITHNSAADMTKIAMVKIATDPELKSLGFRMLIQVHDEIIGECPEENVEAASERFAYVMSHCAEEKIPFGFKTDVERTYHWYADAVKGFEDYPVTQESYNGFVNN